MKMRKIAILLTVLIAASVIAAVFASSATTLTWSKIFKVTSPKITANIHIGNLTIVGYPVNISVALRIQAPSLSNITIKGNYTASLFWFNTTIVSGGMQSQCNRLPTEGQWQQVYNFPSETNVTLTTSWQTFTNATYTPTQEGRYKVVVTFTTNSTVQKFTSGD